MIKFELMLGFHTLLQWSLGTMRSTIVQLPLVITVSEPDMIIKYESVIRCCDHERREPWVESMCSDLVAGVEL